MFNVIVDLENNSEYKEKILNVFGKCKDICLVNLSDMPEETKQKFINNGYVDCFLFSANNMDKNKDILKSVLSFDDKSKKTTKLINLYDSNNNDNIEISNQIGELLIDNFNANLTHFDIKDERILKQNFEGTKNEILKNKEQKELNENEIFDLVRNVIGKLDEYTTKHIKGVSCIARKIAKDMNLTPEEADIIVVGSLLHDVGKIDVPNSILTKVEKLTDEEYGVLRQHTLYGDIELSKYNFGKYSAAKDVASQHHEHFDGSGYPRNLKGEEISTYARIASVADATQAMFGRCYQAGKTKQELINELNSCAGTQFDPEVVKTLINVLETDPQSIGVQYNENGKISYDVPNLEEILEKKEQTRQEEIDNYTNKLNDNIKRDDLDEI